MDSVIYSEPAVGLALITGDGIAINRNSGIPDLMDL